MTAAPPSPSASASASASLAPGTPLDAASLSEFAQILAAQTPKGGHSIAFQPEDVRQGLGKLVLTVVELLRELLERQAIRRMDAGVLNDLEIERLGSTFLQLAEQMTILKQAFGLEDEDLNLDLGPLGPLL